MECVNRSVTHKRFGSGRILSREDGVIRVYFPEFGARAFRYPEAFETFLRAEDEDFAQSVQGDLDRWQEERKIEAAQQLLQLVTELSQARAAARKKPANTKPAAKKPSRTAK